MTQALELLATLAAAVFAGAALYINVAEHPARMGLTTEIAALQWVPSYKRTTWLQAPLVLVSFWAGTAAWLLGADVGAEASPPVFVLDSQREIAAEI